MQRTVINLTLAYRIFILDLQARSVLGRPTIDGRIILKWIVNDG
jgi:hypothetical protein